MKVLVVDDNPLTAMVIAEALKSHNFDAVVAYSGIDALEFLAQHPEVQLIVVDVMMPEMTGYELVGKLREEPYWKDVPVVVCTALANVETVDRIASLGCRHYVLKPVTEEQLLLKVRQALETGPPILEHEDRTLEKVGMDAPHMSGRWLRLPPCWTRGSRSLMTSWDRTRAAEYLWKSPMLKRGRCSWRRSGSPSCWPTFLE